MKNLALLIDGDNAQLNTIDHIIQFCESYGTLKIKKAYGDWEKLPLSSHREKITELGINFVQQHRVTPNATDFRLTMDVAVMLEKKEAHIYFLVSSDNHFTVACEQIRQKGAQVIGIGSKSSISSKLRKACNKFFDVEEIVKNPSQPFANSSTSPKSKPTTQAKSKTASKSKGKTSTISEMQGKGSTKAATVPKPKTQPKPKVEPKPKTEAKIKKPSKPKTEPNSAAMLEILIQAYQKASPKGRWVKFAQLGDVRPQLKQKFGKGYATKPISTWFNTFPEKFEVESDRVRVK